MGRREFGGVAALPVWVDFTGKMLKDVPQQWVSLNNDAKSEKQTQETIEITEKGIKSSKTSAKEQDSKPDKKQPPKAYSQERPKPAIVNQSQMTYNRPVEPLGNSTDPTE